MKWMIVLALIAVASAQRGVGRSKHPKQTLNHRGARPNHLQVEPVRQVEEPEIVEEVIVEVVEPVVEEAIVEEAIKERKLNIRPVASEKPEEPAKSSKDDQQESPDNSTEGGRVNPCNTHQCESGEECVLNKKEKATCVCIKKCPKQKDARAKVCTSGNVTFPSKCEMDRQKCLCLRRDEECTKPEYRANEIDYYGECKEFKKCTKYEMEQFPERMREWLFIVMEELAQRNDLNKNSKKMARRADHMKDSKKAVHWAIPAIWKFCSLDISHDELMTFHELLPMSAPLKGMEHCTEPFLDGCDKDSNGKISKTEWGTCLGITEEEMELKCNQFDEE